MMDALLLLLDLAVLAAYLVAIPICLLKGRPILALFGLVLFGTGAALSFNVFRLVREGVIEERIWWLLAVQGVTAAALLVWGAMRPPKHGSWWDRRRPRTTIESSEKH